MLACAIVLPGCGGETPPNAGNVQTGGGDNPPPGVDPADVPLPQVKTGVCRVYTPQPGFVVLVDGDVVRDEQTGEWLTTPCAITLPVGNHDVKVARAGFRDTPLPGRVSVSADQEAEVVLEPVEDPLGIVDSVLDAPYMQAEVGQPIALDTLNSAGLETDPFVTPDGLAIYFAADRAEGNGIFYATRPSPYVEFFPPEMLPASRGFDDKATPSITADSRTLAFAMPGKQRVVALVRETPLGDFSDKQNLTYSTQPGEQWRSAQMLSDGLKFYWTVERDGQLETYGASRKTAEDRFGEPLRVSLPGVHPCLSSDGLRQYVFNGKTLSRARRENAGSKFSRLETIAALELENYVHSSSRRQYFVTDDEQWLFYCDNPEANGDLFMVRLSQGAGWGFAAVGKSIPQRTFVASNPAEKPDSDPQPDPDEPQVDPRTLPVPYASHWQQFSRLMQAKKYAEAKQLVERALTDAKFKQDRELLEWDRTDVERVIGFWSDVRKALQGMKPGDEIRFGAAKVALVKFEDDEITAKARTTEIVKSIHEMAPVDLLSIADRVVEKTDEAGQARMGAFLFYDPQGGAGSAQTRFERAGETGAEFYERQAARVLHQARQELARDKIAAGLVFVARVEAEFPGTRAAGEAAQLEQEAYRFTKWQQRGRWQEGSAGEFIAPPGRGADSYLVSPRSYENFELRLEWKTAAGGAGGVFFRYRGTGDPNLFGYKIQLADDGREPGSASPGRLDPQTTGALFNEVPPLSNAARPRGEWNTLRMQVRGAKVVVEINGKTVLDRSAEESNFKAVRGYVMLDGVPGGITYRKTLLMELEGE